MFAIQSQITQLNRSSSQLIAREKRRPAAAMNTIVKASGKDDEAKKKNDMPDRGFLSMFAPEGEKSSEDYNKCTIAPRVSLWRSLVFDA
jgi:hypothetical protein